MSGGWPMCQSINNFLKHISIITPANCTCQQTETVGKLDYMEVKMARRLLGIVLVAVSYNYLFLADSADPVTIGLVWLAVAVLVWWPDIVRFARRIGIAK